MSIEFSPERGTISWNELPAFAREWIRRQMPLTSELAAAELEEPLAITEEAKELPARMGPDPVEVERRENRSHTALERFARRS